MRRLARIWCALKHRRSAFKVGWVSFGSVVGRSLGQMSVCRREGGEWRACAGAEVLCGLFCRLMRCRICFALFRRVARSVRIDRGQWGRCDLRWSTGGVA